MELTAEDDLLHDPVTDDPWWTETAWFGFAVPEADLCGSVYQIHRTNQGVLATAVYVWEPGTEGLHELPYYRTWWHVPMDEDQRILDVDLISGLSVRTREPMRSYDLTYRDGGELELDLHWDALHPAVPLHVSGGMGHLDQLGRVRGRLVLHGEELEVDTIEMRDRSWTPRREATRSTHRGYTYGADDSGRGFFIATNRPPEADEHLISGWTLESGRTVAIAEGHRRITRDERGRPDGVEIEVVDGDGRARRWRGEIRNRFALPTSPYLAWMSLVRWTDEDGGVGWGQDHDSFSPARWRQTRRQAAR